MSTSHVIFRKWTGRIRTAQQKEYVDYIAGTGLGDYAKTPGNLGFEMLLRDLGNGETEVSTLSWWASMDAIRGFAGDEPELARYYPRTTSSSCIGRSTSSTIGSSRARCASRTSIRHVRGEA